MSTMRVADYIANFVYDLGVHDVFMLTGAGIMHLTDGVACHGKLRAICVHHEQTASMALEAYARTSQNFGVGYFTTGPGATNAITGLAGAWQDSVPCLFISGQSKRSEASFNAGIQGLRQFGVQELNVIPIVESICKSAVVLNDPEMVRYELEQAVYTAKSGRPGPVWLDVPMDVQAARVDASKLKGFDVPSQQYPVKPDRLAALVDLLRQAKRPVIIAGQGVRLAGAIDALSDFVGKFRIPIVTPYLGIDNMRHDRPEYIGKTGVKGDRPANYAMQNADLVLSIGSSLHVSVIGYDYDKFAREAKKVVVDIDETAHLKKTINIDMFFQADAKEFIEALASACGRAGILGYADWLERCDAWKEKYRVCLPEYRDTQGAINIYSFIDALSHKAAEGDVFVSDAGSAYYATSQGIQLLKANQRYITSGAMATMGYSLPAAIGVSAALGDKRVLAVTGDGSLQQNIQELQTMASYKLPVKLFVLNNDGYLSIRASQKNYFDRRFIGEGPESGVTMPDTLKIADAYGIKAVRVSELSRLDSVLDEVLAYEGPVICDVVTPREQLVIPTVASRVNPDGTMSSRPLEDMFPFLEREEYLSNLLVKEV